MPSFKSTCEKYFGTDNFYTILNLDDNASEKEIKKAYHKLSLIVHPDRVPEDQKQIATEKFKVLGRIHSILQDKDKRKLYDDCGEFDEESDSSFNWMDYWRSMFKKIEIKDIQNYEKEYIGSDTELRDIKKAYLGTKGNMDKMLEMIPFSNCDSEERITQVVQKMVDDGEVDQYLSFFNENKQKKLRRRKKWEKEKKETEAIDMSELEKEMALNMQKREANMNNFFSNLEEKYAPKKRKSITDSSEKTSKKKNKK